MPLWLIALLVSALVVVAAIVHLVRRGLDLYRAMRDSGGALGNGVARVADAAETTSTKAEGLAEGSEKMAGAVTQLRRSQAQLNVLLEAIREVRASIGWVTGIVPRK